MKTPSAHNTEIIGGLGFDFVVLDEEHAPWDRGTLDMGLLAARAFGTAGIVRIARPDPTSILSVLDDGAIGIMAPHVDSAQKARDIVSWSHYKGGSRGLGIGRGGEYGARGADHVPFADKTTTVIAMIEDRKAIDAIDEIAAVAGRRLPLPRARRPRLVAGLRKRAPRRRSSRPSRSSRRPRASTTSRSLRSCRR